MLVIGSTCGAILLGAWFLSEGAPWRWRLVFVSLMAVLLAGMTLPPDAMQALVDALTVWWPASDDAVLITRGSSGAAHVVLFALVSAWLFVWRRDLPLALSLSVLVALSTVTEAMQLLVDGRFASVGDIGLNLLGVGFGWLLGSAMHRIMNR